MAASVYFYDLHVSYCVIFLPELRPFTALSVSPECTGRAVPRLAHPKLETFGAGLPLSRRRSLISQHIVGKLFVIEKYFPQNTWQMRRFVHGSLTY